jgi:hypothetical protein
MSKFDEAKNKLIIQATRVAGNYLLAKYGQAHLIGEPKVELITTTNDQTNAIEFNGKITVFAAGLLNNINVDMTVNSNEIEVDSETSVQSNVTNALNAAEQNKDIFVASLDGFHLTDDGSKYLKVSHTAAQDSVLGIVGKNEYAASKDKSALLQGILKDAAIAPKVEFTGEFVDPTISIQAKEKAPHGCDKCEDSFWTAGNLKEHKHNLHESKKEAALTQPAAKSTWLTADFDTDMETPMSGEEVMEWYCPTCKESFEAWDVNKHNKNCPDLQVLHNGSEVPVMTEEEHYKQWEADQAEKPTIAIKEDMPMARAADYMVQAAQLEEQSALEAQIKVEHEAANELMSTLQGMGYGSAKAVEVTSSKEGFDIMAAVDHAGAVKAVSIPVTVKEGKYILPKKSIIAALIEKGLNVQQKLAEQFDLEALEKLAAIEERIAFEANEVVSILNHKPAAVEKEAAGEKQPFFDSDDSTITLNKHMLPNSDDLKMGDRVSDGTDSYEIVNQNAQQNDKNEGSSSLWTLKKVQAPEHDGKEPKNKIPS